MTDNVVEMKQNETKKEEPLAPEEIVPPFTQIVTAMTMGDEGFPSEALYGLDGVGRVWEWIPGNPEFEGSRDGWELLPNVTFKEGVEPPAKRKPR